MGLQGLVYRQRVCLERAAEPDQLGKLIDDPAHMQRFVKHLGSYLIHEVVR